MNAPNRQAQRWQFLPIPWWPGKFRLFVHVPTNEVTPESCDLTQGTSTLGGWTIGPEAIKLVRADWTFATAMASVGAEMTTFVWNPPITTEQRATQIGETEYDSIAYPWPPILEDAQVVEDATNGRLALRKAWREPFQGKSTVRIRKYVSATPWTEAELEKDAPQDTPIQADYTALQINIPSCLHPKVVVENQVDDGQTVYDLVPDKTARKVGTVVIFPATNHLTLEDHIFDAKVEEEDGLYLLTTYEVVAPELMPIAYVAA